ncbi:MAG: hypothetical protein AAFQ59_01200 [Pseudomonadota bacterium]
MQTGALYQDFGTELVPAKPNSSVSRDSLEDEKLQAFENGYQAGWDDSIKAQANLDLSISSALAANLQDASFQYHEVRAQLTRSMREIMQGVVATILPDIAKQTLGAHLVQLVEAHARGTMEHTIELRVPEAAIDHVERLLPDSPIAYSLMADPTLAQDQATMRLGETEHAVDLGRMVKDITVAIETYFETQVAEGQDDRNT